MEQHQGEHMGYVIMIMLYIMIIIIMIHDGKNNHDCHQSQEPYHDFKSVGYIIWYHAYTSMLCMYIYIYIYCLTYALVSIEIWNHMWYTCEWLYVIIWIEMCEYFRPVMSLCTHLSSIHRFSMQPSSGGIPHASGPAASEAPHLRSSSIGVFVGALCGA